MRRICVSALALSALAVPAAADPLQITPQAYDNAAPSPPAAAQPARQRYAAAQPSLGGGFIEFLFGGAGQGLAAPSFRAPAEAQGPVDQRQASLPLNDPNDAASNYLEEHASVDPKYDRQVVAYAGKEAPGTIVIDTPNKFL